MKAYFPLLMLFAAMIAVAGCTQDVDSDQAADTEDSSEEVATNEAPDSAAPVEHTTLKPDVSAAGEDSTADEKEVAEPSANDEDSSQKPEEIAPPE